MPKFWLILALLFSASAFAQTDQFDKFRALAQQWEADDLALERSISRQASLGIASSAPSTVALVSKRVAQDKAYTQKALALIGSKTATQEPYAALLKKARITGHLNWKEGKTLLAYLESGP